MYELAGTPTLPYVNPATGRNPQGGRSFFVREGSITGHITSSNDNEGTDPQYPLDDIQTALDKCVASMGDYVFVLYHSAIASAPLTIPVRTIHLVACSSGNFDNRNDLYSGGSADAINITSTGRDFELAGFNVGCGSASYNGLEAEAGEVMTRTHIHHCTFGYNYAAKNGIYLSAANACTIDNCVFGSVISEHGIYIYDSTENVIAHNVFTLCDTAAIYLYGSHYCKITENAIYNPTANNASIGWGVHLAGSGSTHNMIWHNYAMDTGGTGGGNTYDPYIDTSAAKNAMTNGWSMNYYNDAVDTTEQS